MPTKILCESKGQQSNTASLPYLHILPYLCAALAANYYLKKGTP